MSAKKIAPLALCVFIALVVAMVFVLYSCRPHALEFESYSHYEDSQSCVESIEKLETSIDELNQAIDYLSEDGLGIDSELMEQQILGE